ncbi:hypothetical protein PIB30_100519, partial [Stylosanthes scabra]|nr:hypothetical protein [Stylosanthes scabra]
MALREALFIAKNLQMNKILFDTDCLNLIQAIKSKVSIPDIDAVLEDIWEIHKELSESGFIWVPRACNSLAHEVDAAVGLAASWSNPSMSIQNLIRME